MVIQTNGNRTIEMKEEGNMSSAEVRLFFYFLIKKRANLNDKKIEEFQAYLDKGELPEEIRLITNGKRYAFCIRRACENAYTLYLSVEEEIGFHTKIRKALASAKK